MRKLQLTLTAALLGLACSSSAVLAADSGSETARRDRMDQAYEDYRNPQPGPAARAESSIKRGAHHAGRSIKHGAEKAGHAVRKGAHKTGDAIRRGGEKVERATTSKP